MLFIYAAVACVLGSASTSSAATIRRDTVSGVSIFAYGVGTDVEIRGDHVFYADGLAYIGRTPLSSATTNTNITFTTDSDDTTVPWTITANSTSTSFNETLDLYIIPTAATFNQVGFATSDDLPTDAVSSGFSWFGTQVAYAASESDYQMQFAAVPTNDTGVFALYWDGAGATTLDGTFPVTLKSTPPTVVTDSESVE
ncbi:hypothetical protein B0O99DRAFT_680358 [Bisporella sp. PMI_857]|nr:hypothetical protein B0O99DRAFT_680358 [Bisporella sp. PMI_857]